jgi:hypothetical protein
MSSGGGVEPQPLGAASYFEVPRLRPGSTTGRLSHNDPRPTGLARRPRNPLEWLVDYLLVSCFGCPVVAHRASAFRGVVSLASQPRHGHRTARA